MTKSLTTLTLTLTLALTAACESPMQPTPVTAHADPIVLNVGPSRQSWPVSAAGLTTTDSWLHPWPNDAYVSIDRNMCNSVTRTGHLYSGDDLAYIVHQDGSDLGVCP